MRDQCGVLHKYFINNGRKRLHKWMHYFDIYERHFARFRGLRPLVLEIGVSGGGSLEMWKDYFGKQSQIVGIDIDAECAQHAGEQIDVVIGDQSDHTILSKILKCYGPPDIIIDDGSHKQYDIISSFNKLYSEMSPEGVYLVEDTHTSYWNEYQGGLRDPNTFIELAKSLIDEINAVHTRDALASTSFTRSTDSISFYDSVVVFEKRPQSVRQAPVTKGME